MAGQELSGRRCHRGCLLATGVVMPEAVQQAMNSEQAELRDDVARLCLRALHADGDVANARERSGAVLDIVVTGESEDVGGRIDVEELLVERAELRIVREQHGELGARTHAERVTAAPQQLSDPCRAHITPLPRRQRRIADDCDPQALLTPP